MTSVHCYVVDDVARTGTLCGGWRGEHRCTMWWVTGRAPVHDEGNDVAGTGTPFGGRRAKHRCTMHWMTWMSSVHHYVVDDVASTGTLRGGWSVLPVPCQ